MAPRYRFNRLEFAGSLGDLGTLLPLAIGMIVLCGLHPSGLFFAVGLSYLLTGFYYGIPVPIQPMKVIGAYAVAMGLGAPQILASGFLMGLFLLLVGGTGTIALIAKYTPKSVIRGVQLSTGTLLLVQGVKFLLGTSSFQVLQGAAEPYLRLQTLGPVPLGIVIGIVGAILTLLFLNNKRLPAGLLVVSGGLVVGLVFGTHEGFNQFRIGLHFPPILPYGMPTWADLSFALLVLVLPQVPMTLGNAVIANADLSREYFGKDSERVTHRALCISQALANFLSFLVGGMPLCHGAGGLAAQYRFGARTAGSNIMIGSIFLILALFLGKHSLALIYLLPLSVLGVLLIFAGAQLALTIIDLKGKKELFVALAMLGITLATNLAVGFIVGFFLAYALKSNKLSI
jgi:SulP family sulfate permease